MQPRCPSSHVNTPALLLKDRRNREDLLEHAHHEAGHFVTAIRLGRRYPGLFRKVRISCLTIVHDGIGAGGRVSFIMDARCSSRPRVVQLLGGVAAESLWLYCLGIHRFDLRLDDLTSGWEEIFGVAKISAEHWGGKEDLAQIKKLIGDEDWEPYLEETIQIVHKDWEGVHRVGMALFERKTMNGAEAYAAFVG